MSSEDDDTRPVAVAAGALLTVPVVIGVALGVLLTVLAGAFAVVSGIARATGGPAAQPSLYMPKYSPTPTPSPSDYLTESPSASPSATGTKTPKASKTPIELLASPLQASKNEHIDLTGTYLNGDGAVLQVQRKEGGGWKDFPVTVTVQGGSFSTYVQTGHTGAQQFRVVDVATGKASNVVTVTVS